MGLTQDGGLFQRFFHRHEHVPAHNRVEAGRSRIGVCDATHLARQTAIAITMDVYSHALPGMQEAAVLALDAKLGRK